MTVVVVVVVGIYAWFQAEGSSKDSSPSPSRTVSPTPSRGTAGGPPRLLALSVTGAPEPLLAVLGTDSSGRRPAAVPVPMGLTMVVPGAGEMRAKDVATLPGRSLQVALSNLVGQWARRYAIMDVDQLAAMVDRTGGLSADLSQGIVLSTEVVGPGQVTLTGSQVRDILVSTQGAESQSAWQAVLTAWLARPPALQSGDVTETNDLEGANLLFAAAKGATIAQIPTKTVAGAALVVDQPGLDGLMSKTFGSKTPVAVIVQNGNGRPGIGQAVARRILSVGFRVAISENATTFDVKQTTVTANGRRHVREAKRLLRALGVGLVRLSRVPSGIADITVVVGEDFTA